MVSLLRPALTLLALFTLLTGLVYPVVITGAAQMLFPEQANGSLLRRGSEVIGSELIGQPFADPGLFWGRPSASFAASNLGPSNPALREAVSARITMLRRQGPVPEPIPVDLVTASGSGLDPHLSPAAVYLQVPRVATARRLSAEKVRGLVTAHVEPATLGILGEPRVNILVLNLALLELTKDEERAQAHP